MRPREFNVTPDMILWQAIKGVPAIAAGLTLIEPHILWLSISLHILQFKNMHPTSGASKQKFLRGTSIYIV